MPILNLIYFDYFAEPEAAHSDYIFFKKNAPRPVFFTIHDLEHKLDSSLFSRC